MHASFEHTRILDLVAEQTAAASVLHQLGVPFYEYPDHTLAAVCRQKGLRLSSVIRRLEYAAQASTFLHIDPWGRLQQGLPHSEGGLAEYPLSVVIAYLKHTHGLFIRYQLPFMADLVANIDASLFDKPEVAQDLKFVFPLFIEDFIAHIHEEEDTVFAHIMELEKHLAKPASTVAPLFYLLSRHSIAQFAAHHLEDDDEMAGIRQLTDNYATTACSTPYTKVIYATLRDFEAGLRLHADIENNLLLPKALQLETEAITQLQRYSILN